MSITDGKGTTYVPVKDSGNRPCFLTQKQLLACGQLCSDCYWLQKGSQPDKMVAAVKKHVWILYQNRIVAYSTTSLVFPYLLVNYSSSIFYNLLYIDIEKSTLSYKMPKFGPIYSALLVRTFGRRYAMLFVSMATMAIMFGYRTVRTPACDAGFSPATISS
ncbi:uncharacterized protein OGAPODRAFT_96135 [Ogataea polymorpha]|uniref:uncharacterized protein n=1 Tax=Ogataea polymorpha TaxID=460523 RepID=UPI0007F47601|nr:uncharacterized protein OGAPODRAFT_96135 [Ogataea polymorpha]OBA14040.1 hypothetical protein OGAPODRAFT_96135 [Ogataea polymorpha]